MIYALRRVSAKRRVELEQAGIQLLPEQNLIVTPTEAIKLRDYSTTREIEKVLRPLLRAAKSKQEQELAERQASLF